MKQTILLIKKNYTVFLIVLLFYSCDPGDGKLTLINNSNDTIFYMDSYNDSIRYFPIDYSNGKINWNYTNYLKPKTEHHMGVLGKWEDGINRSDDSAIRIFFFDKQLIYRAGKDSVLKHQLYSKKVKLTVKDLQKLNWQVVYP